MVESRSIEQDPKIVAMIGPYDQLPADNWLLRKPLPSNDGGYEHKGGATYSGPTDPQYTAITQWLTGATACN